VFGVGLLSGGSVPAVLALAAVAGAFAALGGQDVGVAGVGVAPAQVLLRAAAFAYPVARFVRPAVAQHLAVLIEAGLNTAEGAGSRLPNTGTFDQVGASGWD
jgi:hypothetical protein